MTKLQPLKNGLLAERVAETLRRAIFSGHFEPGGQLLEAHLARELQVSQTTVREALVRLHQIGLVTRVPNKGSFVAKMDDAQVRERLTIRWLLEGYAWFEASQRMSPADFDELESKLDSLHEAEDGDDFPLAADMELEFHSVIWRHSGNQALAETLEKLTPPLFAYKTHQRRQLGQSLSGGFERHRGVVDALRARDSQKLRNALREHFLTFPCAFEPPTNEEQETADLIVGYAAR